MSYFGKPPASKTIGTDANGVLTNIGVGGGLSLSGSTIVGSLVSTMRVFGVAGSKTTTNSGYTTIGTVVINPNDYPVITGYTRNFYFAGVFEVSTSGVTATAKLLNNVGQDVTSGSVTSTSAAESGPELQTSSALTVGTAPDLSGSSAVYAVQIKKNGGVATDSVTCHQAMINVVYTL